MQAQKDLDAWIEVALIDPLTAPLISLLSNYISKNPLLYTLVSFILGLGASLLVLKKMLLWAAISCFLSIFFDGLDGKIARFNQRRMLLHGFLDIIADVTKNLTLLSSLFLVFPHYSIFIFLFTIILLFYEYTYSLRMDLRMRYFSDAIAINYSMNDLKTDYETQIRLIKFPFLRLLLKLYNLLFNLTKKFRTFFYPTIVDAEFLLFVVFLIFPTKMIISLAVLFLLPDTTVSLVLTLLLILQANKKQI